MMRALLVPVAALALLGCHQGTTTSDLPRAVLTLGTSAHRLGLAIIVAAVAVVAVAIIGAIVARQLTKVPENLMKMSVGVMLVSFGTFWTGEGLHVHWPGGDTMLIVLVAIYAVVVSLLSHWSPKVPGLEARGA